MKAIFKINVDEEDVLSLQRLDVEKNTYTDCIQFALTHDSANQELLDRYEKKLVDVNWEFEKGKQDLEKKMLPSDFVGRHQYTWSLEYRTNEMALEVSCECGIQIMKDAGFVPESVLD